MNVGNSQQQMIESIYLYQQVAYHQHMVSHCNSILDQFMWSLLLEQLNQHQQQAIEMRTKYNDDRIENEAQLME